MKSYNIAVLPGDGIGPEVMEVALRILDLVGQEFNIKFNLSLIGRKDCLVEKPPSFLPAFTNCKVCLNIMEPRAHGGQNKAFKNDCGGLLYYIKCFCRKIVLMTASQ